MRYGSVLVAALLLTGCHGRGESMAYAVTFDAASGTIAFTCQRSSSHTCHFTFDDNHARPASVSAYAGTSVRVSHVASGAGFCARTNAEQPCHAGTAIPGQQIVQFDKRGP